ncbi:lytic transglycosylase domain-containing protein [Salmonella enterica]|uniref:transglycosylase SLT domain-containing protein n=1 Tax=Salmonella enterica TaxID=28901 RepID=UPI00127C391B|nr:lytic transglycosylase domain-containing protein [Salmonella enterica subsp. enterica serovar Poona]EBD3314817.1 lytic transglycosylase domain-containing protein [Salmonella enterica]EBL6422447.1 lytic transglycosylase domain-containing protein [Salmonella enterica subsp. enterica serovar Give]ECJ3906643.1 lytic transglycosylase domain-containing protein [Salmonella enterica subsp. enterica serovar Poona]EDC3201447.1 lytic transglycosylase domain-containing protein [Salmonella enterica]
MAAVLDELVLALDIESRDFTAGEQAAHAALDRLTAAMERVADVFDQGQKQAGEALAKTGSDATKAAQETENAGKRTGEAITDTGKKAQKTAEEMESAGKRAATFFSSIRTQVLALAGVTLTLSGIKNLVTGTADSLSRLGTASTAFGMKATHLDGWRRAAQANAVDPEEITGAFSRLTNAKGNWDSGKAVDPVMAELFQTMARAGVNFDPAESPENIMRKLAEIFPRLTKGEQIAYGNSLGFSYAGQQFLSSGHALRDVDDFTSRSQVTPERIQQARELQRALVELDQVWSNIGLTIGTMLMPYALDFSHWLEKLGDWMQQHPEEVGKFFTELTNKIEWLTDKVKELTPKINECVKAVGGWKTVLELLIGLQVASWVWKVFGAFRALGGLKLPIWLMALIKYGEYAYQDRENIKDSAESSWSYTKRNIGDALAAAGIKTDIGRRDVSEVRNHPHWLDWLLGPGKVIREYRANGVVYGNNIQPDIPGAEPEQHAQSVKRPRPTKAGEALLGWLQPKLSQLEAKYNLPPGLLRSVAIAESGGNQFAVSRAGAMGLFQFMPQTAKEFGLRGNDAFDPEKSADAAARKLGGLMRFFHGDLARALAAYNWGEGNVQRKGLAAAPEETRNYIPRVLANLPHPGAAMAVQSRHPAPVSQSTVTETTHIGTLNVTTTSDNVKGITDDARRRIRSSALVSVYSSGVTG